MKPRTKFWQWKNQANGEEGAERVLELYGTIAEESWFDDDITPAQFKSLMILTIRNLPSAVIQSIMCRA